MITTTLRGGLGNQMFMYAMVRAMANRNNTSMAFNLHEGFDNDFEYKRKLELQNFNINIGENAPLAVYNYKGAKYIQYLSKKIGRNILLPHHNIIREDVPMHFQQELLEKHITSAHLEGYWQSEKYFLDAKNIIRNDFKIITPMPENVVSELKEIRKYNKTTVFIGIRRYQECTHLRPGMVLEADYYNKAIEYVENNIPNVLFIVFSQQQEWAQQNLKAKNQIIYAQEKKGELATIEDLYLMTHCDHAIISNSSFYWWGTWLQKATKDHLVIAPNNFINQDSVCEDWVIIN